MAKDFQDSELFERQYHWKEQRSNVRFFTVLFAVLLLFFVFRWYWVEHFGGVMVDGASMNNTLYSGEQLVVEYTKGGAEAKRGDVIVVYVANYPEVQKYNEKYTEEGQKLKFLIKRLIAVEGDSVKCEDGQVYIKYAGSQDYQALDEPYAYYRSELAKADYDFDEYVVGEGEIFFLGDNRLNSVDSRYNEEYGSHLKDSLYKVEDIFGIVPTWAIKHQAVLAKIFFRN